MISLLMVICLSATRTSFLVTVAGAFFYLPHPHPIKPPPPPNVLSSTSPLFFYRGDHGQFPGFCLRTQGSFFFVEVLYHEETFYPHGLVSFFLKRSSKGVLVAQFASLPLCPYLALLMLPVSNTAPIYSVVGFLLTCQCVMIFLLVFLLYTGCSALNA